MRTLSTDQQSAGKERNPRRRRRTRRKGDQNRSLYAADVNVDPEDAPEEHVPQNDVSGHVNEDGSGQTPGQSRAVIGANGKSHDKIHKEQVSESNSRIHRRRVTTRPGRKTPVEHIVEKPTLETPNTNKSKVASKQRNKQRTEAKSSLYAALDLGTNNCRLLIVAPQKRGRFRVVDGFSRIVRLGEGLAQTGNLSEGAMDRAVEALGVCAAKLKARDIKQQRLIATEACRQARNGEEFLSRVTKETGLELEIVSRETEARLAAQGCGSLIDKKAKGAVLFDIGGGSSELILVDCNNSRGSDLTNRILDWTSLPMGVVTLAERFGGRDVTRSLFEDMENDVLEHINKFEGRDALAEIFSKETVHLLGTSGTVTTLAGIHLKLPKYDRRKVDGLWLSNKQIDKVINQLIDMPYEERMQNPCVGKERADLVLAGCAILNAIRKTWPTDRLRVADRGLREGLLSQMMSNDDRWKQGGAGKSKRRRHSANSKKRGQGKKQ